MTSEQYPDTLTRFGFLLVSKYSMIAISSAIEPLRMANRLLGKNLFTWTIITADGNPEPASNDLMLAADCSFNDIPELDIVFVCSGVDVNGVYNTDIQKVLHNLARKKSSWVACVPVHTCWHAPA
ncbi:hypothetical protein [Aliamphritea spongicola]|nr:hypothetical protein [Aliamphritea spongicola]